MLNKTIKCEIVGKIPKRTNPLEKRIVVKALNLRLKVKSTRTVS